MQNYNQQPKSKREMIQGLRDIASVLEGVQAQNAQDMLAQLTEQDFDESRVEQIIDVLIQNSSNFDQLALDQLRALLPNPAASNVIAIPSIPEDHLRYIPPPPATAGQNLQYSVANPIDSTEYQSSGPELGNRFEDIILYTPFVERSSQNFQQLCDSVEMSVYAQASLDQVLDRKIDIFYKSFAEFKKFIPELVEYLARTALENGKDLSLGGFTSKIKHDIAGLLHKAAQSQPQSLDHFDSHYVGRDKQQRLLQVFFDCMFGANLVVTADDSKKLTQIAEQPSLNALFNMLYCLINTFTYPTTSTKSHGGATRYYPYSNVQYAHLRDRLKVDAIVTEISTSMLMVYPGIAHKLNQEILDEKARKQRMYEVELRIRAAENERLLAEQKKQNELKERMDREQLTEQVMNAIERLPEVGISDFETKKVVFAALLGRGDAQGINTAIALLDLKKGEKEVDHIIQLLADFQK